MKFYKTSLTTRIIWTSLFLLTALVALHQVFDGWRWGGLVLLLVAGIQLRSIWNLYWEITPDGILRSKGYGIDLKYKASDLRYAGPVREESGYLASRASRKRDIELELEIEGIRLKRYARVTERSSFLEHLRQVSPGANVLSIG